MVDRIDLSSNQTTRWRSHLLVAPAAVVLLAIVPAIAWAERKTDRDVTQLLERIDNERDRFEDQLDGKLKRSIIRGAGGEINVERYLDDLQENVDKMKERFTPGYAASAEVTTVLRQASDIQRYMSTLPPNFDGASEWNRLSSSLGELAAAYGTTLPIPQGRQARRMNDTEVRKVADDLSKGADQLRKELDSSLKKDKTVDKPTREARVDEAKGLKEDAKRLGEIIGDGRPASGEAQALLDRAVRLRGDLAGLNLPPPTLTALGSLQAGLDNIALAFGLSTAPR